MCTQCEYHLLIGASFSKHLLVATFQCLQVSTHNANLAKTHIVLSRPYASANETCAPTNNRITTFLAKKAKFLQGMKILPIICNFAV